MSKVEEGLKRLISLLPLKDRQVEFGGKMAELHKAILHSFVENGRPINDEEISAIIGDDNFYISSSPCLEDLRVGKQLIMVNDLSSIIAEIINSADNSQDYYFLVAHKDLDVIRQTTAWAHLSLVTKLYIGGEKFVLLTTEKHAVRIRAGDSTRQITVFSVVARQSPVPGAGSTIGRAPHPGLGQAPAA